MYCRKCGKQIAQGIRFCPNCGFAASNESELGADKDKSRIQTKNYALIVLSILVGLAIVLLLIDSGSISTSDKQQGDIPYEYKAALAQAKIYSDTLHMSKAAIYDQLVSEYGGKFPAEAAQYAVDNVKADWKANALASARDYQRLNLSVNAIHAQLISEYGGKFTEEEADYAIENLE